MPNNKQIKANINKKKKKRKQNIQQNIHAKL